MRLADVRTIHVQLFLTRSFDQFVVNLLCAFERCLGPRYGCGRLIAGLACREQEQWQVLNLVGTEGAGVTANGQNLRMAASSLPPALLQAVNERISGEPLNAAAEAKARSNGWH